MKCPHCQIHYHQNWGEQQFLRGGYNADGKHYRTAVCPGCTKWILEIAGFSAAKNYERVYPSSSNRGVLLTHVPKYIAEDYIESCAVLAVSPKAAAALSRRGLQSILNDEGYVGRNLAKQIDALLGEPDPKKSLSLSLRETIDCIRNFGDFSAHPVNDITTPQIIDVEPAEAEWCLDIMEEMFEFFYTAPAVTRAKKPLLIPD